MVAITSMIEELEQEIAQKSAVLAHLRNARAAEHAGASNGIGIPRRLRTLEMAAEVLRADGHPLHSRVIAERIAVKYDFHSKATSIGTMLWRASKQRNSLFVKERSPDNTYGLREWQK